MQIVCFAGIYMKLGDLMSMFSLNAGDSQSMGRRIFRRPYLFMRHRATILMVTHDPFSASFCERILFLKDGKIFNEIFRGEKSRKDFFNEILDILTLLGGEVGNVR